MKMGTQQFVMPRSSPNSPAHWIRSGLNVMGWFAPFAIWCQNLSLDSEAIVEGSNTAANIRLVVLKGSKPLIFSGHLDLQLLLPQGGRVGEGPRGLRRHPRLANGQRKRPQEQEGLTERDSSEVASSNIFHYHHLRK